MHRNCGAALFRRGTVGRPDRREAQRRAVVPSDRLPMWAATLENMEGPRQFGGFSRIDPGERRPRSIFRPGLSGSAIRDIHPPSPKSWPALGLGTCVILGSANHSRFPPAVSDLRASGYGGSIELRESAVTSLICE